MAGSWEWSVPNLHAYGAAKAGVIALTRHAAVAYAQDGIRVNAIAPGLTMTDFQRRHSSEELLNEVAQSRTPLKRLGTAEDMAAAAVFLCGAGASFITGEIIEINGGLWVA